VKPWEVEDIYQNVVVCQLRNEKSILYAFVIRADYRGVNFTFHAEKDPKANAIALAKESGTVFHPQGLTKMISIDLKNHLQYLDYVTHASRLGIPDDCCSLPLTP
jgi:hypothetical protein